MLNLNEKEKVNALNEVRLLASVKHPNIVQYKESFIDEQSQTLCLVMEYADDGDLSMKITEHVKNGTDFTPVQIVSIVSQMILGLKALHDSKICHRDLKCANIFLTSRGEAKLGDFNVSKVLHRGMLHT
jgi:NIMA (never in mitosis gene a)-related kinase